MLLEVRIYSHRNYYNRRVIKNDGTPIYTEVGVNFNPNDGVDTTLVVGKPGLSYDGNGSYLWAGDDYEPDTYDNHWYIIEQERLRNGQYKLYLHRDVVRDYYNSIISAPCFVEKATLNEDDPAIFNSENMTFNQIKTAEYLLRDTTNMPWVVGYYQKTGNTEKDTFSGKLASVGLKGVGEQLSTPITGWEFYKYKSTPMKVVRTTSENKWNIKFNDNKSSDYGGYYAIYMSKGYVTAGVISSKTIDYGYTFNLSYSNQPAVAYNKYTTDIYNSVLNRYNDLVADTLSYFSDKYSTANNLNDFLAVNGKLYQDTEGRVYLARVVKKDNKTEENTILSNSNVFIDLEKIVNNANGSAGVAFLSGSPNSNTFTFEPTVEQYSLELEEQVDFYGNYDLSEAVNTQDAPYNIFCMPYADYTVGDKITVTKNQTFNIANEIIRQHNSDGTLYDIQLLPYCPLTSLKVNNGAITLPDDKTLYSEITDNSGNPVAYIFNAPLSAFSFYIDRIDGVLISTLTRNITDDSVKVENETGMFRLCSPNYNGQFEFNYAKNKGLHYFKVDCTYKPFSPYIHVSPDFNGLYGQDFNDVRGLICGGNFGLPLINDKWIEYEAQNKNYQNIFNRQIENMEIQQKYQRGQEIAGMITGALGTGAMAGGVASVFGAGAGIGAGIGGGLASLAGGIADLAIGDKLRAEALDYTKDLYGYQLGNIKALPDSLTRVDAFTNNNKIFPVLEYYTCTDVEKDALRNKLKYNGMSVGRIGKISDFLQSEETYIKGKIIRLGIDGDTHLYEAIYEEIYKGVFIK